jgi:hypothetical protein
MAVHRGRSSLVITHKFISILVLVLVLSETVLVNVLATSWDHRVRIPSYGLSTSTSTKTRGIFKSTSQKLGKDKGGVARDREQAESQFMAGRLQAGKLFNSNATHFPAPNFPAKNTSDCCSCSHSAVNCRHLILNGLIRARPAE